MTKETSKTVLDFLPELQEALQHSGGTHTVKDVARMVLNEEAQLWVEGDGLIVTEIEQYPQGPVLNFWLAAGEMNDVLAQLPEIYEWGREVGCEKATMTGRRGWERVLAHDGWERTPLVHFKRDL